MAHYKKTSDTPIGQGGFGAVFNGQRTEDGWECVIKYLREPYGPDDRRRFQREVRMQSLLKHPFIVSVVGRNLDADPPWFVMPKAECSLRRALDEKQEFDPHQVFSSIALAIKHAHDNGVFHRDLKPENVLVFQHSENYRIFAVTDFGLGRQMGRDTTTLTLADARIGTPAYMAPEQWFDAHNAKAPADIYALGKILYELLTGLFPYPKLFFDQLPEQFRYLVRKATAEEPQDRYQSMNELISAYQFAAQSEGDEKRSKVSFSTLINSIIEKEQCTPDDAKAIAQSIGEIGDDITSIIQTLPTVPSFLITALLKFEPAAFLVAFRAFDGEIGKGITYEYCDVVADFYESVFECTDDQQLKRLILKRLVQLGAQYNRWHVGRAFARLVEKVGDAGLIHDTCQDLRENPPWAEFHAGYLRPRAIPKAVRECLPPKE